MSYAGSSPRGRGTRLMLVVYIRVPRFISARAGNTIPFPRRTGRKTVHPRAGGEHSPQAPPKASPFGSSPRGRGTLQRLRVGWSRIRFIPARAGNTPTVCPPCRGWSVHPRAGGEHEATLRIKERLVGSSPRGRGTRSNPAFTRLAYRFIPARAGNTSAWPTTRRPTTVHPRAGGEHEVSRAQRVPLGGSSPRGRGTLSSVCRLGGIERFIPARAGNTQYTESVRSPWTVHPRAGGEHMWTPRRAMAQSGSSPRGRGTPLPATD